MRDRLLTAARLDADPGMHVHRLTLCPLWVFWRDDGRRYLAGDVEPTVAAVLPLLDGGYG